ncbi:MAG TPA: hypothetical protein VKJ01_04125 [Candidatus Solibacter sp.]|nr:hypothetical protein [Candidatus Solibacter sp.]
MEIRVILLNLGREPYTSLHAGDRIAQMIVARYEPRPPLEITV